MLALVLAGVVLAGTAVAVASSRQRPERRPVRVETKDRRTPPRR